MSAIVSRTKGHCSVCPRGRARGASPVVLIKLALTAHKKRPYTWLGICLECARAVAKEIAK